MQIRQSWDESQLGWSVPLGWQFAHTAMLEKAPFVDMLLDE